MCSNLSLRIAVNFSFPRWHQAKLRLQQELHSRINKQSPQTCALCSVRDHVEWRGVVCSVRDNVEWRGVLCRHHVQHHGVWRGVVCRRYVRDHVVWRGVVCRRHVCDRVEWRGAVCRRHVCDHVEWRGAAELWLQHFCLATTLILTGRPALSLWAATSKSWRACPDTTPASGMQIRYTISSIYVIKQ